MAEKHCIVPGMSALAFLLEEVVILDTQLETPRRKVSVPGVVLVAEAAMADCVEADS